MAPIRVTAVHEDMGNRVGASVSVAACLLFLGVLAWPYAVKPASAVTTYYRWGVVSPLFAGALVLAALAAFVAVWWGYASAQLGIGLVLGTSLVAFVTTSVWVGTARLDVFRASGWALPAQRFVLVGLSALAALGAAWHAHTNGLVPSTATRSD